MYPTIFAPAFQPSAPPTCVTLTKGEVSNVSRDDDYLPPASNEPLPPNLLKASDDTWLYGVITKSGLWFICEKVKRYPAPSDFVTLRNIRKSNLPVAMRAPWWTSRGVDVRLSDIVAVLDHTS